MTTATRGIGSVLAADPAELDRICEAALAEQQAELDQKALEERQRREARDADEARLLDQRVTTALGDTTARLRELGLVFVAGRETGRYGATVRIGWGATGDGLVQIEALSGDTLAVRPIGIEGYQEKLRDDSGQLGPVVLRALGIARKRERDRAEAARRRRADEEQRAEADARLKEGFDQGRVLRDLFLADLQRWSWPTWNGRPIVLRLYQVRWCSGAAKDEGGGVICEYEERWSLSPEPDGDGYITILDPTSDDRRRVRPAQVPTVVEFTVESVRSLASISNLVWRRQERIPGLRRYGGYAHPLPEGHPSNLGDADPWLEDCGEWPHPAIRRALTQLATAIAHVGPQAAGDLCARCGAPIDHNEPHVECDQCRTG